MIRSLVLAAALTAPPAVHGQSLGGTGAPLAEVPRSVETFAGTLGYADLSPDRYGSPGAPRATELGMYLVLRTFRTVCLGLELGFTLDDVTPDGFTANDSMTYLFGDETGQPSPTTVLSPTGSVDMDEDEGRPTIWLTPDPDGMVCRVEWQIAEDIPVETQEAIARLLSDWMPYEMSLMRVTRPDMVSEPVLSNAIEWDRPCMDRWCPTGAVYGLSSGRVALTTKLSITDIEGDQP